MIGKGAPDSGRGKNDLAQNNDLEKMEKDNPQFTGGGPQWQEASYKQDYKEEEK